MAENDEAPPAPTAGAWVRWRPRLLRAGFAVATGCLFWAAVPDTDLWWLGFVMWVPWLWMLEDLKPKAAFVYGMISGVSAIAVGYFWMTELLLRFAFHETNPDGTVAFGMWAMPLSVVVHLVFSCWQGSGWGLAAALLVWARKRTGIRVLWLAPLAWTFVEATLPNLFPTYMALAWCWHPRWIQIAELGGVTMVTFSMVAINAALYGLLRAWIEDRRVDRAALITWLAWMIGLPTYGTIRMSQVDAEIEAVDHVKVGVVQGNFGIETYRSHRGQIRRELRSQTAALEAEGAQLALWGETAYPGTVPRDAVADAPNQGRARRYRIRRGFTIPVIMGVITREIGPNADRDPWNTAWVLESDDSFGDRYDKVYLLLFGEAAPAFVDADWYTSTFPAASNIHRGPGPGVLRVAGYRFGPLICYEDILPRFVRDAAQQDVHAFVNLTNDSWFGKTREQPEHLGLAVFRTIEQRKALLRSVNAGISAHVDPAGRVLQQTEVTDSDTDGYEGATGFVADVAMMDPEARTVYGRTGETFNVLVGLVLFGLIGRSYVGRRREDEATA
jgi:apolipoprotein N-acyltransferase